jgi:hypothetical protein
MKRTMLASLAALVAASVGAPFSIGAAQAVTDNISGATCTWDANAQALNCAAGSGGPANAPACSISVAPGTALPSTGGTVTLTANCSPAATTYSWQKGNTPINSGTFQSIQDSLGANTGAAAVTTSYFVTGCLADGTTCGNAATTSVSVAGSTTGGNGDGGPPPAGFCGQYPNVVTTALPWQGGFTTQGIGKGFQGNATIVASFTVPANFDSAGRTLSLNIAEFGGPPTSRIMTISKSACDFRTTGGLDPTGVNGPIGAGAGTTASIRWSSTGGFNVAKLVAGQTYYLNIQNKSGFINGVQSCATTSVCDAIVQMGGF